MHIKQNQFFYVNSRKQTSTHTRHSVNSKVTKSNQNLVLENYKYQKKMSISIFLIVI